MNKIALIVFLFCIAPVMAVADDIPRDGIYKEYYDSGKIKAEYHYQNGQLNGPAKLYYENGFLREDAFYTRGKLHGINKKYYTNGLLSERATYRNGAVIGVPFKFEYGDISLNQDSPDQRLERQVQDSAWWIIPADKAPRGRADAGALQRVREFIEKRFMFAGIVEADYTLTVDQDRIYVRVSSLFDHEDLLLLLSSSGVLYFKGIESDPALIQNNMQKTDPAYEWVNNNKKKLLMEKQPWLTVPAVETADLRDAGYNKKKLVLKFKKAEAEILKEMTAKHLGEQTAVVLGGNVITVLSVDEPLRTGELALESELLSENRKKVLFSLVFSPDIPVNVKVEEAPLSP